MKKLMLLTGLITLIISSAISQNNPELPVDPKVKYGKLSNGLTYYIRHNELPKERVDFYIAQKVGSMQEEENQRGLAHFLEHMAFNGSKNFPENNLTKYLETIGVKFGENLNAYTSFDETVYYISNVPVARESAVDSCILILHDWSGALLLEEKDIDKERGVIREEMRSRNEATMRLYEKLLPILMPNNKYASRMPIGTEEVVMNFKPDEIRQYYKKWYRPDLQGIIIVGDIDVNKIESKLKEIFADIPAPVNPAERIYFEVDDNAEPIVGIVTDKEAPISIINIDFKHKPVTPRNQRNTMGAFISEWFDAVAKEIVTERFRDLSQKSEPPFIQADGGNDDFLVTCTEETWNMMAAVRNNDAETALKTITREAKRIDLYGFTESEYERAKSNVLTAFETNFNERDKTRNENYANNYVNHFLKGGYIPGIEIEYSIAKTISEQIPLNILNQYVQTLIRDSNIVICMIAPEKEDVKIPTNQQLLSWFNEARNEKIEPIEESVNNEPLIENIPTGVNIKSESDGKFGSKILTLSNDVKVIIKSTNLKDDEILFTAFSPGGSSLFPQDDQINVQLYNSVTGIGGLGKFSKTNLSKALAGKRAAVQPTISLREEGLSGSSSVKDFETLLQLIYLNFTDVRKDEEAFKSFVTRTKSLLKSMEVQPQNTLQDSITKTIYVDQLRHFRIKADDLDKVNYQTIENWRKERYANADDFTFIFTGNINVDSVKNLIAQYLGNLPASGKKEKFIPLNEDYNKGIRKNAFNKEMENLKSTAVNFYWTVLDYNLKNRLEINMLLDILKVVYTEKVREEEGGTYGVQVGGGLSDYPKGRAVLNTSFETDPAKVEYLNKIIHDEIKTIADNGPSQVNFDKVKEHLLKAQAENEQKNRYWLNIIKTYYSRGYDDYTEYLKTINKISPNDVRKKAKALTDAGNVLEVIMTGVK
ncbi:MAG: insulinase family protein [Dysgonamonadaceae bacterium]|nr:insulinase family protein [Dysgonamonadaceae bacterium]